MENLIRAETRQELRAWLAENAHTVNCCWVLVSIKEQPAVIRYMDAVEEALCFGWIDGIMKKLSDTELAQRLSPRKKASNWTELNKERVRRLNRLGLMTEQGLQILPDMRPEAFKIDPVIEARIKEDSQVYENFLNFPELYRRIRIDTIQSYRHDADVYNRRLDKFIHHTKHNRMYGQWNDEGRLSGSEERMDR